MKSDMGVWMISKWVLTCINDMMRECHLQAFCSIFDKNNLHMWVIEVFFSDQKAPPSTARLQGTVQLWLGALRLASKKVGQLWTMLFYGSIILLYDTVKIHQIKMLNCVYENLLFNNFMLQPTPLLSENGKKRIKSWKWIPVWSRMLTQA